MKLKLRNVRLSFADGLFKAKAMEAGQTPKYGADFLLVDGFTCHKVIPATLDAHGKILQPATEVAITPLDAMIEVANETWKGKGKEMLASLEASKKTLRDGNKRVNKSGEPYADYVGLLYFSAKNKKQPALFTRDRQAITSDDGTLYSGCYVTAVIDVYGVADPKKKGVHGALMGVQFLKDGEAFAGAGSRADESDFDDLSAGADAADVGDTATAGLI